MSKIDVKCTNCGETVQLDDSRTEGFCNYCGSKIMIKELMKEKPKTENEDSRIVNYIALAESAIITGLSGLPDFSLIILVASTPSISGIM